MAAEPLAAEPLTRDPAAQRRIVNRLKRASGQLNALVAAIEAGAPCRDVVTQLSAVSAALDRAGYQIVASAMRSCLAEPAEGAGRAGADGVLTPDELEKLFLMLA